MSGLQVHLGGIGVQVTCEQLKDFSIKRLVIKEGIHQEVQDGLTNEAGGWWREGDILESSEESIDEGWNNWLYGTWPPIVKCDENGSRPRDWAMWKQNLTRGVLVEWRGQKPLTRLRENGGRIWRQ